MTDRKIARYPLWLTIEDANRLLDIIEGENRLVNLLPVLKSASNAKGGDDPIAKRIRVTEQITKEAAKLRAGFSEGGKLSREELMRLSAPTESDV